MRRRITRLLLLFVCLLTLSCAGNPGLRAWHTDVEYDRALQGSRRALVEMSMAITTMDFKNGFITAEKRWLQGLFFKDEHVWQMNVYIKRTDNGILIEAGAVATAGALVEKRLLKEFAKNLKKYVPDAKFSSAY